MKKYIVIALSVFSDKANKVYNAKDEVTEECFHEGHADKLVADGFLEEVKEEELAVDNGQLTNEGGDDAPTTRMVGHIIDEDDLLINPSLAAEGLKVGDEVEVPVPVEVTDEQIEEANRQKKAFAASLREQAQEETTGGEPAGETTEDKGTTEEEPKTTRRTTAKK